MEAMAAGASISHELPAKYSTEAVRASGYSRELSAATVSSEWPRMAVHAGMLSYTIYAVTAAEHD